MDGDFVLPHDCNSTAAKGKVCWGPGTRSLGSRFAENSVCRNAPPKCWDSFAEKGGWGSRLQSPRTSPSIALPRPPCLQQKGFLQYHNGYGYYLDLDTYDHETNRLAFEVTANQVAVTGNIQASGASSGFTKVGEALASIPEAYAPTAPVKVMAITAEKDQVWRCPLARPPGADGGRGFSG